MKRSLNSDKKKGGVKWDEENLEENEKIKQELNPIKITEPKTPYLSPMETDDELDLEGAGMSPLSLEDEEPSAKRAAASWPDPDKGTSGSSPPSKEESAGGSPAWERRSPRFNDYYKDDSDTAEATSDAEHAQDEEKKRRFKELRKKHYNMREALKKVKEAGPEEGEEDAGAEADVEDAGEASGQGEDEVVGLGAAAAPVANGHVGQAEQPQQPEQPRQRQQPEQGPGEGRTAVEDGL